MNVNTFFLLCATVGLIGFTTLHKARAVCCPAAREVFNQTGRSDIASDFYQKCVILRGLEDKMPWPAACNSYEKK